jgi:hypothetical protein
VMGVHFNPGGGFPFLGLAADELTDTHINLRDIWGRAASGVHERLSQVRRSVAVVEPEILDEVEKMGTRLV